MTERVKGFVVTLADDVREDDAQEIITALSMVRGVIDVRPAMVDFDDHINRERIRQDLARRIYAALSEG